MFILGRAVEWLRLKTFQFSNDVGKLFLWPRMGWFRTERRMKMKIGRRFSRMMPGLNETRQHCDISYIWKIIKFAASGTGVGDVLQSKSTKSNLSKSKPFQRSELTRQTPDLNYRSYSARFFRSKSGESYFMNNLAILSSEFIKYPSLY